MQGRNYVAFGIVQALGCCAVLWVLFRLPLPWDWQRMIGTGFVLIGMSGIAAARIQLGRSFSITAQARKLVTQGIYSKIRNPIYVFGTVLLSGFVLIIHKPIGWLLVLAIGIVQIIRAHREAQVLEAAFGDDYRAYRQKTWF